ncbi:hypothetical protein [Neolewinella aurantiaca]|nr:hypothetical protein [Neolewinella aurantiaca]
MTKLIDSKTGERKYLNRDERKAFLAATQLEEAKVKYWRCIKCKDG